MITGNSHKGNLPFYHCVEQKRVWVFWYVGNDNDLKPALYRVFVQQKQTNPPKNPSQLRFHNQLNWQRQLGVMLFPHLWNVIFPSLFLIREDIFFSECNFSSSKLIDVFHFISSGHQWNMNIHMTISCM